MVNFTCPHCGQRTERADLSDDDVEYVDLGNGLPDAVFPRLRKDDERHNDQRLCCAECYDRAAGPGGEKVLEMLGKVHPYSTESHRRTLREVDRVEANKRGLSSHGRFKE
jgi:hypothetical protein